MKHRLLFAALAAIGVACVGINAAAQPRTTQVQVPTTPVQRPGPGTITTLRPDLIPIPSRITSGVVSVQNAGTAPSAPTTVTVNCHRRGQTGGCPEIPARYAAGYTNAAFPNRLTVEIPSIEPGHTYNHNLTFWSVAPPMPSGTFIYEFVADASSLNNESNETNNNRSFNWVVP